MNFEPHHYEIHNKHKIYKIFESSNEFSSCIDCQQGLRQVCKVIGSIRSRRYYNGKCINDREKRSKCALLFDETKFVKQGANQMCQKVGIRQTF